MQIKLDDIDHAIVEFLQHNGRASNREIGRQLNLSEGAVRQRLKKLIDGKAMRLGLVRDVHAAGLASSVILRLQVVPAHARKIAEQISKLDICHFAALSIGQFNVVAVLTATQRREIAEILESQIAVIAGVQDMQVQEQIGLFKHRYELVRVM